ncbi:MAG: hypothetical protein CMI09_08490 [Oceanospirillaceae bacterium]|nr:hypothetical protein [Oceanospirillaceae bacterium]|tara:strand:- start:196 stop:714 length:519 start_codon:yes stop_codon:yes gene_type:complete
MEIAVTRVFPLVLWLCAIALSGCGSEANTSNANATLVKVDKSERRLYLMHNDQVLHEFHIALGGNPRGHKQQEGDHRTPEGRYILDYKKEDSSFYRAIHISYPNAQDTEAARAAGVSPGGLIMIHGQPNRFGFLAPILQWFDWTEGCIALTNREMDIVMDVVQVGTPIEIEW